MELEIAVSLLPHSMTANGMTANIMTANGMTINGIYCFSAYHAYVIYPPSFMVVASECLSVNVVIGLKNSSAEYVNTWLR
jgi:hypothetical protein